MEHRVVQRLFLALAVVSFAFGVLAFVLWQPGPRIKPTGHVGWIVEEPLAAPGVLRVSTLDELGPVEERPAGALRVYAFLRADREPPIHSSRWDPLIDRVEWTVNITRIPGNHGAKIADEQILELGLEFIQSAAPGARLDRSTGTFARSGTQYKLRPKGVLATSSGLIGVLTGVAAVRGGVLAWKRRGRRHQGRCVLCGYDLAGLRHCPECGAAASDGR